MMVTTGLTAGLALTASAASPSVPSGLSAVPQEIKQLAQNTPRVAAGGAIAPPVVPPKYQTQHIDDWGSDKCDVPWDGKCQKRFRRVAPDNWHICQVNVSRETGGGNYGWMFESINNLQVTLYMYAEGNRTWYNKIGADVTLRLVNITLINQDASADDRLDAKCSFPQTGTWVGRTPTTLEYEPVQCIDSWDPDLRKQGLGLQFCQSYDGTRNPDGSLKKLGIVPCGVCVKN